jgi:predicted Fe-Mo cluster-binding NifX family protein
MKVAIPTNNMSTISAHFGRSKGFMIYDIEDKKIINFEYKINTFTGHAKGQHKEHEYGKHNHSHEGIFGALGNCKVVIAGGMGQRLYNDFNQREIQVFVTQEKDMGKAIELFLNNSLENTSEKLCNH